VYDYYGDGDAVIVTLDLPVIQTVSANNWNYAFINYGEYQYYRLTDGNYNYWYANYDILSGSSLQTYVYRNGSYYTSFYDSASFYGNTNDIILAVRGQGDTRYRLRAYQY
jgi:hypothetical protein